MTIETVFDKKKNKIKGHKHLTNHVEREKKNQSFGPVENLSDLGSEPYFCIIFNCSDFNSMKDLYHIFISTARPVPPDRLWVTILATTGPIGLVLVVAILIAGKFLLRRR